ncbi:Phosphatidate cytidylyltransferase [Pseudobythopirellula maris]|uniref:Phosphatidate cytidylyltransferase n=1 Tax=Pseudobythopirellula maris TaxID=2527991 RepID=A0A5C5ZLN2_9BACT|nr:Phosphatidate cytidylyltransferase [Pseudobythopirellula maris]
MLYALAWLDLRADRPGVVLLPLALVGSALAAGELVRVFENSAQPGLPAGHKGRAADAAPRRRVVLAATVLVVLVSATPMLWLEYPKETVVGRAGWVGLGLAIAGMVVFVEEMVRYAGPGAASTRLARSVFTVAYAGGLMGFVAQLRLLAGGVWDADGRWGMVALLSLIVVVKMDDTGAYFAGRALGRHKMTPILSPGKTWEGALGGFALSAVGAMIALGPLAHALGCDSTRGFWTWLGGCLLYALLVGAAGMAGDLAVSLLKRDAQLKNSSTWMPGFGGVLDLLDSILFAAPVAYFLWIARIVGP